MKKIIILFITLFIPVCVYSAQVIDDMNTTEGWRVWGESGSSSSISKITEDDIRCIRLSCTLINEPGHGQWVQMEKEFYIDISRYNILKVNVRGGGKRNNFQIKLEDIDGSTFGMTFESLSINNNWIELKIPIEKLQYFWGGDKNLDLKNIKKIMFTATAKDGGTCYFLIDNLIAEKGLSKNISAANKMDKFEAVKKNKEIASKTLQWVKSRMNQNTGLIESYVGDKKPFSWTYDNAISLIMFSRGDVETASKLAKAYKKLQNEDGSWFDGYLATTAEPVTENKWVGSIAWMIHALCEYIEYSDDKTYIPVVKKATEWLLTKQNKDGSFHSSTEGNLDCWWALEKMGYDQPKLKLENYLLTNSWDEKNKRFVNGPDDPTIYLDLQTWGAEFAKSSGHPDYGLWSLPFAEKYLKCKTFDDNTEGLDGGGPYTVWFEGTLQYICAGGPNSQHYLNEVEKHLNDDGSIRHSHERYDAGTIWHTTMLHIAPSAWIYFANTKTPFIPGKINLN